MEGTTYDRHIADNQRRRSLHESPLLSDEAGGGGGDGEGDEDDDDDDLSFGVLSDDEIGRRVESLLNGGMSGEDGVEGYAVVSGGGLRGRGKEDGTEGRPSSFGSSPIKRHDEGEAVATKGTPAVEEEYIDGLFLNESSFGLTVVTPSRSSDSTVDGSEVVGDVLGRRSKEEGGHGILSSLSPSTSPLSDSRVEKDFLKMTELLKMMEEEPQSMAEGEGGASRDAPTLWNRRRYRTPIVSGIEGSAEVAIEKDPSDEGGVTSGGDWWKGTPLHPQGEASAPVVLNRMTNNDGAVEGALNSSKRRMHREFATIEEGGRKGKEEDSSFDRRRTNGGSGDIQESGAMRVRAGSDLAKDGSESGNDSDDPILGSAKGATKFPNDIAEVRLSKLVRSSPVVTSESPSDGTKRKDKNIIDDDKWDDWKRRLESLKIKASTPVGGAQPKTDRVPAPPSTGSKNGSKNFPSPASEGCRSNSERSTGKKVIRDSERNIKAVSQQSPVELERLIDGISPILNSSPSCFNGHQNNVGDREEVKNLKLLLETREQQVNKCRQQLKEVTEKFNLSTQHLQKISEQNAALSTEIEEKRNNEKDRIYTIKVLENKISSLRSALTNANNKLSTIKTEKEEAQAVQTEELQRAVVETNAARNEAQCLQDRLDKIMDANERHRQTIHNLNTKQEQRTKKEDLQESKLRRIAKQNVVLKENLRRLEGMHQKEKETKKDIISKLRGELDSLKESSGRENQYFLSQLQTAQTHVDNERRMRRALQDEIKVLEEENRRALDRCLWDSEEREFSSNHLSQKLKASGIRKTNDNDSSRITRTISNSTSTKLDDSCSLDERLANLAKTISSFDDTSVDNR